MRQTKDRLGKRVFKAQLFKVLFVSVMRCSLMQNIIGDRLAENVCVIRAEAFLHTSIDGDEETIFMFIVKGNGRIHGPFEVYEARFLSF